jgi:hypothetical protein
LLDLIGPRRAGVLNPTPLKAFVGSP